MSLETLTPAAEFDVVAFSCHFEEDHQPTRVIVRARQRAAGVVVRRDKYGRQTAADAGKTGQHIDQFNLARGIGKLEAAACVGFEREFANAAKKIDAGLGVPPRAGHAAVR